MSKFHKIWLLIFVIFILTNCISIKFDGPGYDSGYNKLDIINKERVVFLNEEINICDLNDSSKIFSITAKQLRNCLINLDTALVYKWSPNCSAKSCISLSTCLDFCQKKNYKLFVVADYFDFKQFDAQYTKDLQIFIPNHKYYKTDYSNKYNRLFKEELMAGERLIKDNKYDRFLFFHNGNFVKSKPSLFN